MNDPTNDPTLTGYNVSVDSYSLPPDAEQPDTSDTIDTLDARLMNAVYEYGSLWTAHAVSYDWDGSGDTEAAIKWYEIDVSDRSVEQSNLWGREDGYYCFPTVSTDPADSMMMVYNEIGPDTYARVEVAGRTWDYDQGLLEDSAVVKTGESDYDTADSPPERWGDYNGIVIDPTDNSHYWAHSQYAWDPDDDDRFETWVAESFF